MGRRTATTPEGAKRRFLEELRRGSTVGEAARAAGIGRRTAYDLRQRDETFAVDWADAIEEGTDHLIAAAANLWGEHPNDPSAACGRGRRLRVRGPARGDRGRPARLRGRARLREGDPMSATRRLSGGAQVRRRRAAD